VGEHVLQRRVIAFGIDQNRDAVGLRDAPAGLAGFENWRREVGYGALGDADNETLALPI
jgi:hypothetical protein